ncbi:MAG: type III secretion system chaperone [Methylocystis sp.]|uniref:type III secretion system chaperone n=1 Tax=Methylocystis sp. TaxID=1911079 RepID=UPI003DA3D5BA
MQGDMGSERETVGSLIAALGEAVGLSDLSLQEEDACGLSFDDIAVTLAYDEESGALVISTLLQSLEEPLDAAAMVRVMDLNAILFNHDAAAIVYDRDELAVFQLFRITAADLSKERFLSWVERSVSTIETTHDAVQKALAAEPEEEIMDPGEMSFFRP